MANPENHLRRILSEHWRFGLGVLVAANVLLEVMLRLLVMPTYPPVKLGFDHGNRNCARPVPGSVKTWHSQGILGRTVVHRVNNLGIRDDVPDLSADLRVVVLGGASVYGVGVETRETLPAAMEKLFAARYPERQIRFLNFGFPGFDLEEQIRELARLEPVFKPDVVIVTLDNESFQPPLCSRRALPIRNLLTDNLALARIIERHVMPVDLVPGNAMARRATVTELLRLVAAVDDVSDGRVLVAALDSLPNLAGNAAGLEKIREVIELSGHELVIPGRNGACENNGTESDRTARDKSPLKDTAERIACSIEPFVTALLKGD